MGNLPGGDLQVQTATWLGKRAHVSPAEAQLLVLEAMGTQTSLDRQVGDGWRGSLSLTPEQSLPPLARAHLECSSPLSWVSMSAHHLCHRPSAIRLTPGSNLEQFCSVSEMPPTPLQILPKYCPEALSPAPFPSPILPACVLYLPYGTNYFKHATIWV